VLNPSRSFITEQEQWYNENVADHDGKAVQEKREDGGSIASSRSQNFQKTAEAAAKRSEADKMDREAHYAKQYDVTKFTPNKVVPYVMALGRCALPFAIRAVIKDDLSKNNWADNVVTTLCTSCTLLAGVFYVLVVLSTALNSARALER
jgi:hypothetical protein